MGNRHHEPLVEADVQMPSERSTGLVFAGVTAIAAVFFLANAGVAIGLGGASVVFAGLAWLRPDALRTLNVAWFRFALALNTVVSPVIMLLLFAVVMVPCGLVMQMFRDPLQTRRAVVRESYWIARDEHDERNHSSMRDQF